MAKKYKGNFQNKSRSEMSAGQQLAALGYAVNPIEPKENINRYKDSDLTKKEKTGYVAGSESGKHNNRYREGGENPNRQNPKRQNQNGKDTANATRGEGKRKNKPIYLPIGAGPHAPYNFVRVDKRVMEDRIIEHPAGAIYHTISDELYSGRLSYHISAQTPILVDSGKNGFYRNKDGVCVLPGSTMRGLIRNHVQILSFSGVRDDIDDYNLMYRAVAGGCLREQYATVLGQHSRMIQDHQMTILQNVKAGYIEREGKNYYLYGIDDSQKKFKDNEANYYVVSERYVLERARGKFRDIIKNFQNRGPFEKYTDKNGRIHYKDIGKPKPQYKPYFMKIKYRESNGRVCEIVSEDMERQGFEKGYLLSSGTMNEKKAFYVIPEINRESSRLIPQESVVAFQADYNRKIKAIEGAVKNEELKPAFRAYFDLPQEGETRPAFYIDYESRLYFGYTPRLRLMYTHTILDGLRQENGRLDFAKAMFGYSNDSGSRKSKVFFTDAVLMGKEDFAEAKNLILAEPQPTSYLEYLNQGIPKRPEQNVSTYNNDDFSLRGVKQYWLQKQVNEGELSQKEKVKSKLNPLERGSEFAGEIRFQNLSKEELGLLIWSVRLEKDSQMNVGKAKAYGYGRIRVDQIQLYLQDIKHGYVASPEVFGKNPYEEKFKDEQDCFVDAYKKFAAKEMKVDDIMKIPTIRDFFYMKSHMMETRDVKYMSLSEFANFKKNNNPLPTVEDIAGG